MKRKEGGLGISFCPNKTDKIYMSQHQWERPLKKHLEELSLLRGNFFFFNLVNKHLF